MHDYMVMIFVIEGLMVGVPLALLGAGAYFLLRRRKRPAEITTEK